MPIDQRERLAILQDVSKSWLNLVKAIRGLSDEQLTRPGVVGQWSVKDVMAHISAWEREQIERIDRLEHGEQPRRWSESEIEAFNTEQARLDAERDLDEVRDDFEETHAELMGILEITPVLTRELVASGEISYEHYSEHAAQIRAWRASIGA